jgi:hypothetical protein
LPVIQANQPLTARRHVGRLRIEDFVNVAARALRLRRLVAREVLLIPMENGTRRRLAAFKDVKPFRHGVGIAAEHAAAEQLAGSHC